MLRYYRIHIVSKQLYHNWLTYFNVSYVFVLVYTQHYFTKLRHIRYLVSIILKSSYLSKTTCILMNSPPRPPRIHLQSHGGTVVSITIYFSLYIIEYMTMGTRSTLLNNSPSLIQPTLRPSTSPISNTPPLY